MEITKLYSSYVDGSGMDLSNASGMHDQLVELFEDKIEDYTLVGNGMETCFLIVGDDTGAPLTSISGEFTHDGEEYTINISPDNDPVEIKIKLDTYDKDIAMKIALKNLEASFKAKDIKINKFSENDYKYTFDCSFKGMVHYSTQYKDIKRSVEVFKEGGNHIYRTLD
jgi:hypothetical protein